MRKVTGIRGLTHTRKKFQCQNPPACWMTISFRFIVPVTMIMVMTTSSMGIS